MGKNEQAIIYGVANAVLVLFAQQVASGTYPISEPYRSVIGGVVALLIAGLTVVSPWFSARAPEK